MASEQWSPESLRLREEAGEVLDRLARSMNADRSSWGRDNLPLDDQHLTAWLVIAQYQSFDDPEASLIEYATSGVPNAVSKGLAAYALEAF